MKTSLKKLQKFVVSGHDKRPLRKHQSLALDELARATQDMSDMRDCYDKLLSAAAATANSVYEFSESLRDMGDCLLEKTALSDDEESGKVLLMLGKAQFEFQKLVDNYRSHIAQTITVPSESLLNELHIVEEMKRRCDEKREIYEELLNKQRERGRLRNNKGECFSSRQLQEACDEYEEEANVFVLRVKSLKQGRSRSLLTQASRHHAAQLCFIKKALKSLEAIEPHVRLIAEQMHIDYQFSSLLDDGVEVYDNDDEESDSRDIDDGPKANGEEDLSFAYAKNGPVQEDFTAKNAMELDIPESSISPVPKSDAAKEIFRIPIQNSFAFRGYVKAISKSAPLFPERKLNQDEQPTQLRPSASRKFTSYVLPTPDETKSAVSNKFDGEFFRTREPTYKLWHSSPLGKKKYEISVANDKLSGPIILDTQSVLKESDNRMPSPLPPPLSEGPSLKQMDGSVAFNAKKVKRQTFSGPLTDKLWTANNKYVSSSEPIASSSGNPPPFSGSLLHTTPFPLPSSTPKLSSFPKISELHELPLPPSHSKAERTSDLITHSGPIISKSNKLSNEHVALRSALTLPVPPPTLPRSYSIPAGGTHLLLQGSQMSKIGGVCSPPLTPIVLPNMQPASSALQAWSQSVNASMLRPGSIGLTHTIEPNIIKALELGRRDIQAQYQEGAGVGPKRYHIQAHPLGSTEYHQDSEWGQEDMILFLGYFFVYIFSIKDIS